MTIEEATKSLEAQRDCNKNWCVLTMTIADVKHILNCEIARRKDSHCYDSAAAIEYALETATDHWDEYDYKDDFVIHREYTIRRLT